MVSKAIETTVGAPSLDNSNEGHLVFVYGTLLKNEPNYRNFLNGKEPIVSDGEIQGRMVSLGGFPGVIGIDEADSIVYGEVYRVTSRELASLDRLEGYHGDHHDWNLYNRVKCSVHVENDTIYDVWTYEFNRGLDDVSRYEAIPHGSWRKYLADKRGEKQNE